MIEQVARIISEFPEDGDWSKVNAETRAKWERLACAAVEVERERCEGWAQWYRSRSENDLRSVIHSIRSGYAVPDEDEDAG